MNPEGLVKEERSSFSGERQHVVAPKPVEGLHDIGPPPFLTKTYDIVEDASTNHIVSWRKGNNSFAVWDPQAFSISLLPRFFKHSNFSSFVRQLNTYGFRKVHPDRWEFANEGFLRGQRHLLKNIRRRNTTQPQTPQQALDPCVEVRRFGLDGEVDRLRCNKQVLMVELVKLRQQQQNTRSHLQSMKSRLQKLEQKQQHMVNFLLKAMQNPNFLQQLIQQKERRKELEGALSKKIKQPIDQGLCHVEVAKLGNVEECSAFVKPQEHQYTDHISELEVSYLDLAMNMQDQSGGQRNLEEKGVELECRNKDIDQVFWEDLLNEGGSYFSIIMTLLSTSKDNIAL